ncbi:TonB-dependent receptor [Capnocytophaga sp.]|uniref:SusC/RagA family TonB-linked outer membrane protein n=1 Tax=Capnocytophaga sp. TaxID=44737 RepID=UPI0026DBC262|nr:TonB-dependent receptor [Capnocytophaga sp.]MDO5105021.1 TonB-dependent receptor [Capnocytophaga sp.]
MFKRLTITFVLMLLALPLSAQVKVTGKVTDESNVPLPGANIVVKGTAHGVVSDFDGNYEIQAKQGDVLEVSFIGFQTQTKKIAGRGKSLIINFLLKEDAQELGDVIVVGYGTSTKKALVSAVSSVKTEDLKEVPVTNVTQGLAGRSPGLIVKGSAGLDNRSSITIRGGGTPLVVIDGVIRDYNDFVNILPEDIASISILKDASATAVYGARAANGILQVTTLKGQEGQTTIQYTHSVSILQPSMSPARLDAYAWATQNNIANQNDGKPIVYTDDKLQKILDGSDLLNYPNVDWKKLVLKDFAEQYRHNLNISGGKEENKYLVSLGYTTKGSYYRSGRHKLDLINFRLNQDFTIGKNSGLKGFASVDGYFKENEHPYTSTAGAYYQVFSHTLANHNPLTPALNKYGLPYANTNDNPVAETSASAGYSIQKYKQVNGMVGLEWAFPWVKGLKARTNFNYRYFVTDDKRWKKDGDVYDWDSTTPASVAKPELYQQMAHDYLYTTQNFLEYASNFNAHSLNLLAGYEASYTFFRNTSHKRINYNFPIDQFGAGPKDDLDGGGSDWESGRAGFVGQLKYNYANRYFLEGSVRHDASDLFPKDKRWGTFFSGSAGWIVSDEFFMKSLKEKHIFDLLKFRASYGEVGLDSGVNRFSYLPSYVLDDSAYVIDGKLLQGFSEGNIPSPDITWYTTKQLDFGFDFESLNNRLFGSFDYFFYKTTGYLTAPDPNIVGYTAPLGKSLPKIASNKEHRREGFEAQLGWKGSIGDEFKYHISANATFFESLFATNPDEALENRKNPYLRTTQQIGYYGIGLRTDGFFTDAQDVYSSPKHIGSHHLTAGDIKYQDFNGDGKIDNADRARIGKNNFPRANYGLNLGFSYKSLSFNMLFQGATRFDMYVGDAIRGGNPNAGTTPIYEFQLDYWKPDNTSARFPRLLSSHSVNGNNNTHGSDFYLINGAYLRLKDFSIAYDLKKNILKDYKWLSAMKLTFSGQNILTISEATQYGMDPETTDTQFFGYPNERMFSLGVNVGF